MSRGILGLWESSCLNRTSRNQTGKRRDGKLPKRTGPKAPYTSQKLGNWLSTRPPRNQNQAKSALLEGFSIFVLNSKGIPRCLLKTKCLNCRAGLNNTAGKRNYSFLIMERPEQGKHPEGFLKRPVKPLKPSGRCVARLNFLHNCGKPAYG